MNPLLCGKNPQWEASTTSGRARVAPQVGERLSGRGKTGWLARTQGGRQPQRGSMPVRSTDEDSRPTEDNARRPVSPRPAPGSIRLQPFECGEILVLALGRRLDDESLGAHPAVVQQARERREAKLACADVRMAVEVAAAVGFGVIGVEYRYPGDANRRPQFAHRGSESLVRCQVVARRPGVAGVH